MLTQSVDDTGHHLNRLAELIQSHQRALWITVSLLFFFAHPFMKSRPAASLRRPRVCCVRLNLVPGKCSACLIFDDPRFEEIFLLAQIHDFRHPWEWIFDTLKLLWKADLNESSVGDEL